MLVQTGQFGTDFDAIIRSGKWEDDIWLNDISKKIKPTLLINGEKPNFDEAYTSPENSFTITFTVGEEDLTGGSLYVTVDYYWIKRPTETCGVLVSCTMSAPAAALVAPQEVAMLPEKKD